MLIPKYGMYGAAIATVLSSMLQFIMFFNYAQKLVFITYDYKFIFKSVCISLGFFSLILYLSYLKINIAASLGLKAVLFLVFVLIADKLLGLKKAIKGFFDYAITAKQAVS